MSFLKFLGLYCCLVIGLSLGSCTHLSNIASNNKNETKRDPATDDSFEKLKKAIDSRDIQELYRFLHDPKVKPNARSQGVIHAFAKADAFHYLLMDRDFFRENQKSYLEFLDAFLFNMRANVTRKDSDGYTPLKRFVEQWGRMQGAELVARRLLRDPAIKSEAASGRVLHTLAGAFINNLEFLDEFLRNENIDKNHKGNSGMRPVMGAAWHSTNPEVIRRFIRNPDVRLDFRAKSHGGKTVVDYVWENLHLSDTDKRDLLRDIVFVAEVRREILKSQGVKRSQQQALRRLRIQAVEKLAGELVCY